MTKRIKWLIPVALAVIAIFVTIFVPEVRKFFGFDREKDKHGIEYLCSELNNQKELFLDINRFSNLREKELLNELDDLEFLIGVIARCSYCKEFKTDKKMLLKLNEKLQPLSGKFLKLEKDDVETTHSERRSTLANNNLLTLLKLNRIMTKLCTLIECSQTQRELQIIIEQNYQYENKK